jgi:phage terminase small subunit
MKGEIKKNTSIPNKNEVKEQKKEVKDLINSDFAILDEYFANGYNGTKAVLKIKPHLNYNSARREASQILKNPANKDYIAKKRYDLSIEANTTINRLVKNLGLIANATITDYVGLSEAEIKELPYEISYPLKKVTKRKKVYLGKNGSTEEETTISYELKDGIKAIDMLGKHLGIYEVHNQQKQKTIDLTKATPEQLNAVLLLLEQQKETNEHQ